MSAELVRVVDVGTGLRVLGPPAGVAMLACECGRALSRSTMQRRPMPKAESGASVRIEPICCEDCAGRSL